jgi:hemolysin-activating ACP:hemolysin acyltransferase
MGERSPRSPRTAFNHCDRFRSAQSNLHWTSGDKLWVVEVIAPFGGAEEMLKDLKAKLFREREIRLLPWQPG